MQSIRLYIVTLMLVFILPSRAQLVATRITTDPKLEATMTALYGAENALEVLRRDYYNKISRSYTSASIASVGIFLSKQQNRKAMIEVGLLGDVEFGCYKRILDVVVNMIMPKAVTVAMLMIQYPAEAMVWGSYLFRVLQEVKMLCMIFESVVTNGSLSFRGVDFLQVSDEFKVFFDLARLGDLNWPQIWDGLTNLNAFPTRADLMDDLNSIINQVKSIASSGYENVMESWTSLISPGDLNFDKILLLYDTYQHALQLLDDASQIKQVMTEKLGDLASLASPEGIQNALSRLLTLSDYNITEFMNDYVNLITGRYYRQRYYIYADDSGSEEVDSYVPNEKNAGKPGSDEWVRYESYVGPTFTPNASQLENIKKNTLSYCSDWISYVNQKNATAVNEQYSYKIGPLYKTTVMENNSSGGRWGHTTYGRIKWYAYAYGLTIMHKWNVHDEVHEAVYDSENMSYDAFMAQLNGLLEEYNDNDEDIVYQIGKDEKNYYDLADKDRLNSAESVNFVVNCHDCGILAQGSNQWKENCFINSRSLTEACKGYAMSTSLPSSPDVDLQEMNDAINQLNKELAALEEEVYRLEVRNSELLKQINAAAPGTATQLRKEYKANQQLIKTKKAEMSTLDQQMKDYQNAREELINDYQAAEDDDHRIPAFIHEVEAGLDVTWSDPGGWSGFNYIRHGVMGSSGTPVTFICEYKMVKAEQFINIFGIRIRIHRARLALEWRLESNLSSSDIVDVMELSSAQTDEEKQEAVNRRMREIQNEYPACAVELEYNNQEQVEDSLTDNPYHLLWMSDRVRIANAIEWRVRSIYSELLLIEKFMAGRRTAKDLLKQMVNHTIIHALDRQAVGDAHRRWLESSYGKKVSPIMTDDVDGDDLIDTP